MTLLADMHTHSRFSVDGRDCLEFMCQAAIDKGLKYICFTEHFDLNPRDMGYGYFKLAEYSKAIEAARIKFGDRICILKGLEFGEPHLYPREFEAMQKKDFDVIIAGIHFIGEYFVGEKEIRNRYSAEQIVENYYHAVLDAVKLGGFDILAHLGLPRRYFELPDADMAIVDQILQELVKADIALEINTSSIRKGQDDCLPGVSIVKRYAEHGGSRITLGSDAHSCPEIAADFDCALHTMKIADIQTYGIYQQREYRVLEHIVNYSCW